MTPAQVRAARAFLSLSVDELAVLTGFAGNTICNLELGRRVRLSTVSRVRATLEAAGIVFTSAPEGVQLTRGKA